MFSARGVALNVTTASVQLCVLHNSVYLSAWLKLRGTNSTDFSATKQPVCTEGSRLWANRVLRGIFANEEEVTGDEQTA
jgi:hypothetical protein